MPMMSWQRKRPLVPADVFGTLCAAKMMRLPGQEYEDMAEQLDYICPMIYSSHYGPGNFE